MPPAPPVLKPLAARSFCFGVGWRSGAIVGLLRHPCTCPDLETFFHKNAFQHIFPRKCVPNRFWDTVSNSPSTGTMCPTTPKRASGNERAIKPGVQGACPRPSFSPFLGRNGDPRRAGGPPGALRPEAPEKLRPPEGYVVPYQAPARDRAGTNVAGSTLRWFQRNRLPMTEAPGPSGATPTPSGQMKEKPPGKGSRFCASCSFFAPSRKNP